MANKKSDGAVATNEMTLREFLEGVDENTVVHIGAKDGSSFFYIGKPSGFDSDKYSIKFLEAAKRKKGELEAFVSSIPKFVAPQASLPTISTDEHTIESYVNACMRLKDAYIEAGNTLVTLANNMASAGGQLKVINEYLLSFVTLDRRTVAETYPRLQNDGIVVLINGTEKGEYWNLIEFKANKK